MVTALLTTLRKNCVQLAEFQGTHGNPVVWHIVQFRIDFSARYDVSLKPQIAPWVNNSDR